MQPLQFMMRIVWTLNAWLAHVTKMLVVAFALGMVLAIAWQVLTRALLSRSPPWTEEVALLMFSWIILLMIAIGVREHLHVRMDSLVTMLPPPFSTVAEKLITLLVVCIGCYLVWSGIGYLAAMRGSTSQAIHYPSELLYSALPVASVLVFSFAIENLLRGRTAAQDVAP